MRYINCFQCLLFLLGCISLSLTAQAGSWSLETIASMPVQIYTPDSQPVLAGKRALMISTGGCGQQASGNTEFRDQSNWESTAEDYGMIVAVPNAPSGGVLIYGCWDYYDANHTRTNRHNDNVLDLVAELLSRGELNIDPNQVYFSGLSSGGGMVNVLACLAPDVFAGGGNSAGPALGTSSGETTLVATTATQMRTDCLNLAGSNAGYLDSQVFSLVWGSADYLAAPGYADVIAEAFGLVYGADKDGQTRVVDGVSLDGVEETWSDGDGKRISKIFIDGLAHAWPAGGGSGASFYMDNTSVNYPAELTSFLFANNRRASSEPPAGQNSLLLNGSTDIALSQCEPYAEPGFTATDAQLGDITNLVQVAGDNFDPCVEGGYTISYSVTFSDSTDATDSRTVTVSAEPEVTCSEYTGSNWDHLSAGRAEYCGFILVCAVGSGDFLGYPIAWPTNVTLAETADHYFELGNCPN